MNINMIISQNVRGLKRHEKKDEFLRHLRRQQTFAALLQETWLTGDEAVESEDYTLICSGLPSEKKSRRVSHEVAIALSSQAMTVWGQSGMEIARVSSQVISIRMMITDHQKRENGLILISAYDPIGADSDETWTSFFEDYDAALKMCKINDTILAGMDRNSSMETNDRNLCGPFGIPHTNGAGRIMHSFLSISGLTTTTTFFHKKSHGTWIHSRSKFSHQLDHIITNRDKLCTVTDEGVTESMIESDHRALKCKFHMQLKLAKRPPPPPLRKLNLAKLQSQETSTEFCEKVTASIIKQQSNIMVSPTSTHTIQAEAIKNDCPLNLRKSR